MDQVKVSLCPACDACPEVEATAETVRIGEAGRPPRRIAAIWRISARERPRSCACRTKRSTSTVSGA